MLLDSCGTIFSTGLLMTLELYNNIFVGSTNVGWDKGMQNSAHSMELL